MWWKVNSIWSGYFDIIDWHTLKVLDALWSSSDDDFNFIGVGKSSISSSLEGVNLKSEGGGRYDLYCEASPNMDEDSMAIWSSPNSSAVANAAKNIPTESEDQVEEIVSNI